MRYITLQRLNIRRQPRITGSNLAGVLDAGTERDVLETLTDAQNNTWGRISEPDNAGVSLWICIKGLNREYARLVPDAATPPVSPSIEARLAALEARVAALESR